MNENYTENKGCAGLLTPLIFGLFPSPVRKSY